MECDVIPDCTQEVDPLGNIENCDLISNEGSNYGGSLNAQIISSSDGFIVHTPVVKTTTITGHTAKSKDESIAKTIRNNQGLRKTAQSRAPNLSTSAAAVGASSIFASVSGSANAFTHTFCPSANHTTQASTMKEVLASIPGFQMKPRRRTNKKMSTAAQLEQTREGCIDLETPDSILVGTNLRDLLNRHTFSLLPPLYQYKLIQLLPVVDRPPIDADSPIIRLNASSLNNEFFARACLEWRERLSEGISSFQIIGFLLFIQFVSR